MIIKHKLNRIGKKQSHTFDKKDVFFSKTIGFLLILNPMSYFLKVLDIKYLDTFFSSLLILGVLFHNRRFFKYGIKIDIILIFVFFMIATLYSGFQYTSYLVNWLGIIYILFLSTLPWYIVGRYTSNYQCVLYYLKKYAFKISIVSTIIYLHKVYSGTTIVGDMALSYAFLPAVIISLYAFFVDRKMLHLLNASYSITMIFIGGSRGPILCICSFVIMFLIANLKKHKLLTFSISTITVLFVIFWENILVFLIQIFRKYGLTSRTLIKLYAGTITSLTGRDFIQSIVKDLITENPLMGVGIGVERITIYNKIYVGRGMYDKLSTSYPHNLFLEILVQFGVIIGGVLIIYILYNLFTAILKGNNDERNLVIIFIGIALMQLMVSSTYLQSQYFFYLLGIAITLVKGKGHKKGRIGTPLKNDIGITK